MEFVSDRIDELKAGQNKAKTKVDGVLNQLQSKDFIVAATNKSFYSISCLSP